MIKVQSKRHFLLLEVMIAFALIVLCIFPLLYPHAMMLRAQNQFIHQIELDHAVNLIYADVYERLLKNEIPWNVIETKQEIPIDQELITRFNRGIPLPYKGTYQFTIKEKKAKKDKTFAVFVLNLTFTFTPNEVFNEEENKAKQKYTYEIFAARVLGNENLNEPIES